MLTDRPQSVVTAHSSADLTADFSEGEFYVIVYYQDAVRGYSEETGSLLHGHAAFIHKGLRFEKHIGKLFHEIGVEFRLPGIREIHPL